MNAATSTSTPTRTKSSVLSNLFSVISSSTPSSSFFPNKQASPNLKPDTIPQITITTTPTGTVTNHLQTKLAKEVYNKIATQGIPATAIQTQDNNTLQNTLNHVGTRLTRIEEGLIHTIDAIQNYPKPTEPEALVHDSSLITNDNQELGVNLKGIAYKTTVNGGLVNNVQDFLQITTATLNTITALGGVNEGENQEEEKYSNKAALFDKKAGNRFLFRTLVSRDNSILFTTSEDNKTIDLKLNLDLNKLPDNSLSANVLHNSSVALQKLAPQSPKTLLGNSRLTDTDSPHPIFVAPPLVIEETTQSIRVLHDDTLTISPTGVLGVSKLTNNLLPEISPTSLLANPLDNPSSPQAVHLNTEQFTLTHQNGNYTLNLFPTFLQTLLPISPWKEHTHKGHQHLGLGMEPTERATLSIHGTTQIVSGTLETKLNTTVASRKGQIIASDLGNPDKQLTMGYDGTQDVAFLQSQHKDQNTPLVLQPLGGSIGIGISSNPEATLHVVGTVKLEGIEQQGSVGADRPLRIKSDGSVYSGSITLESSEIQGVLPVSKGGTGTGSAFKPNQLIQSSSQGALTSLTLGDPNQALLTSPTATGVVWKTVATTLYHAIGPYITTGMGADLIAGHYWCGEGDNNSLYRLLEDKQVGRSMVVKSSGSNEIPNQVWKAGVVLEVDLCVGFDGYRGDAMEFGIGLFAGHESLGGSTVSTRISHGSSSQDSGTISIHGSLHITHVVEGFVEGVLQLTSFAQPGITTSNSSQPIGVRFKQFGTPVTVEPIMGLRVVNTTTFRLQYFTLKQVL